MTEQEYNDLQRICDNKLKEVKSRYGVTGNFNRESGWKEAILCMKSILSTQFKPSNPNRGFWYKGEDGIFRCSHCHKIVARNQSYLVEFNYCPRCGVKIDANIKD